MSENDTTQSRDTCDTSENDIATLNEARSSLENTIKEPTVCENSSEMKSQRRKKRRKYDGMNLDTESYYIKPKIKKIETVPLNAPRRIFVPLTIKDQIRRYSVDDGDCFESNV